MIEIHKNQQDYLSDNWHKEFIEAKFINANDSEDNNFQIWLYNGWGYDNSTPHCQVMTNNRETIIYVNLIDLSIIKTIGKDGNIDELYNKFINWLDNKHPIFNKLKNDNFLLYMFDGGTIYGSYILDYIKENNIKEIREGIVDYMNRYEPNNEKKLFFERKEIYKCDKFSLFIYDTFYSDLVPNFHIISDDNHLKINLIDLSVIEAEKDGYKDLIEAFYEVLNDDMLIRLYTKWNSLNSSGNTLKDYILNSDIEVKNDLLNNFIKNN
ncbi:MAG: hypothetical protein IKT40_08800 [Bacilli bacterium]|nr:hypothetical protein [Bacilli bacterium]